MTPLKIRDALKSDRLIVAPGIQDMITAVIANKVGFDFVYASGFWSTASAYGLPDAGIATYSQMVDRVGTLARTSKAGVIADADTGYGGLLNVHHTVRGYEEAGICAIQIEDQEFPKKCGHTPYRRVIPRDEMVEKVKVACDARRKPDETLIIARTDARQPEDYNRALDRAAAYADAGADIIFVEALESVDEMRDAAREINRPMMANMATGGLTPILSATQLEDLGYSVAIFPALASLSAAAAAETALKALKETGDGSNPPTRLFNFEEFCSLIGFDEVWEFEQKWAQDD